MMLNRAEALKTSGASTPEVPVVSLNRSLYRALRELRQLQAEKAKDQSREAEPEEPALGSFFPGAESVEPEQEERPKNPAHGQSSEQPKPSKGTRKPPRSRST
jgi:hypothetical protein